jgi:hypothetical protein
MENTFFQMNTSLWDCVQSPLHQIPAQCVDMAAKYEMEARRALYPTSFQAMSLVAMVALFSTALFLRLLQMANSSRVSAKDKWWFPLFSFKLQLQLLHGTMLVGLFVYALHSVTFAYTELWYPDRIVQFSLQDNVRLTDAGWIVSLSILYWYLIEVVAYPNLSPSLLCHHLSSAISVLITYRAFLEQPHAIVIFPGLTMTWYATTEWFVFYLIGAYRLLPRLSWRWYQAGTALYLITRLVCSGLSMASWAVAAVTMDLLHSHSSWVRAQMCLLLVLNLALIAVQWHSVYILHCITGKVRVRQRGERADGFVALDVPRNRMEFPVSPDGKWLGAGEKYGSARNTIRETSITSVQLLPTLPYPLRKPIHRQRHSSVLTYI